VAADIALHAVADYYYFYNYFYNYYYYFTGSGPCLIAL
jgi:hypothetical protein